MKNVLIGMVFLQFCMYGQNQPDVKYIARTSDIGPTYSHGWNGETEAGLDGKGASFVSQYTNYDFDKWNLLTRYFWVNGQLSRGEFAFGPNVKLGKRGSILKFQFGASTEKSIMTAGTIDIKIGHEIFHIVDGKISTTDAPSTLYQKLFVALDKKGKWQVRIEDLQVGRDQAFFRLGGEYRWNTGKHTQIAFAPFYDPIVKGFGGQVDFRFFQ